MRAERIEQLGLAEFFVRHRDLRVPRVLAPVTAHYSWSKGLKLLGLGRAQLQLLPEHGMRLDADALQDALEDCLRERQPVLMTVAVLGTTEYGTIDPVDRVIEARDGTYPLANGIIPQLIQGRQGDLLLNTKGYVNLAVRGTPEVWASGFGAPVSATGRGSVRSVMPRPPQP